MKIIDRYILKTFLAPFSICIVVFSVLVVLGRFFEKMSIFNGYRAAPKHIAAYLALSVPYWLNLVLPVATMLALLFSLGQLNQRGEWTAFRSAGIASGRLYAPFIVIAVFLAALSLTAGSWVLPRLNLEMRTVYRVKIKKWQITSYRKDNVVAAGRYNRRFTIGWLDVESSMLKDVVIDRFDDAMQWMETYSARRAYYHTDGRWLFEDGIWRLRVPDQPQKVMEKRFNRLWVTGIPETPADFALEDKKPDDMTLAELRERIKRLRWMGAPSYKERVAFHQRLALPFAHLIVIALAIPFALRSGAHGRTQNFSYAMALAFLYWGGTTVAASFGDQGRIPAWLAAWASNGFFGLLGAWRLARGTI